MLIGVTVALALLLAPLILLTACFAIEILAGLRPLSQSTVHASDMKAVIIVPAHNEEPILATKLAELQRAAHGQARMILVADNCTDGTAEVGRRLGVETIERFDPDRRGKGFALDFAMHHLHREPPDVVLVVDADCGVDKDNLKVLIQLCAGTGRPCQAHYIQIPSADASASVRLSAFAFFIKNVIRQRALQRLAGRANLVGSGMAFPWEIFSSAEHATSNIVEDLKLGQELANSGHPPLFIEHATVWSDAASERDALSQRSRWEGGFIQNALLVGPPMLSKSLIKGDGRGVWAAIDAMIPPFALLTLLDLLAAIIAGLITWITSAHYWPLLLLVGSLIVSLVALGLAWCAGGARFVSLDTLWQAPVYVLRKLPMYVGFARGGVPKEWLRTRRN